MSLRENVCLPVWLELLQVAIFKMCIIPNNMWTTIGGMYMYHQETTQSTMSVDIT